MEWTVCPVCRITCELTKDTPEKQIYYCDGCKYLVFFKDSNGNIIFPHVSDMGLLAGYLYRNGSYVYMTQTNVDRILADPHLPKTPSEHLDQLLLHIYSLNNGVSRGARTDFLNPPDGYVRDYDELTRMCNSLIEEYQYLRKETRSVDPFFPEEVITYYMVTQTGLHYINNELLGKEFLRILKNFSFKNNLLDHYESCKSIAETLPISGEEELEMLLATLQAKEYISITSPPSSPLRDGMCKLTKKGLLYLSGEPSGTSTPTQVLTVHQQNSYVNNGGMMINAGIDIAQLETQFSTQLDQLKLQGLTAEEENRIIDALELAKNSDTIGNKIKLIANKLEPILTKYGPLAVSILNTLQTIALK